MGCGASSEAADEVVDDGEDAQCYVITTPAVLPTDDSLKQAKLHALTVEPPKGLVRASDRWELGSMLRAPVINLDLLAFSVICSDLSEQYSAH